MTADKAPEKSSEAAEMPSSDSGDEADAFARLEAVLARRLEADAELMDAVEACQATGDAQRPGLYESLARTARSDTETVKKLLTTSRFEPDLSQADVDAWDAIPTAYDTTEDDDDQPFRP